MSHHRWQESEHPRRPRGSEGAGEWVGVVSDRLGGVDRHWPRYTPGRALTAWVGTDEGWAAVYRPPKQPPGGYGNHATRAAASEQGWIQPVEARTDAELDAAVAVGGVQLWRGVKPVWGGPRTGWDVAGNMITYTAEPMTAHEVTQQLRDGDIKYGRGIYTHGIYTTTDIRTANAYADHYGGDDGWGGGVYTVDLEPGREGDSVVRMVLRPDARLITYGSSEYHDEEEAFRHFHDVEQPQGPQWGIDYDLGHWFALRGYDAIYVDSSTHSDDGAAGADQYIILNPTALIMSQDHRADYGPVPVAVSRGRAPSYDELG